MAPRIVLLTLLAGIVPAAVGAGDQGASRQRDFGIEVARQGLWREARFRFERSLALQPDNASGLNDLAIALEQAGEFDKAREAYEKALKLDPKNVYIQQNYDLFREADDKRNRKARKKP